MRDADSDFFEAGGDSLAAFQITAGLRDTLGTSVPTARSSETFRGNG